MIISFRIQCGKCLLYVSVNDIVVEYVSPQSGEPIYDK